MRRHRAHVVPGPVVEPPASLGRKVSDRAAKLERKRRQASLWPEPDVCPDGQKRR